jgi:hypothetical protein
MKIQNFELEVEGNRDDVPLITQSVGQQFAGLLAPATDIVEGEIIEEKSEKPSDPPKVAPKRTKRSNSGGKKSPKSEENGVSGSALLWDHDENRFGSPKMEWNTADKAIWLLYVIGETLNIRELTSAQICTTFNHHFRNTRAIKSNNTTRDLKLRKTGQNLHVGQDNDRWYLTTAGIEHARNLIQDAKNLKS